MKIGSWGNMSISHVLHHKKIDGVEVKIIQQGTRKLVRVNKENELNYCYTGTSRSSNNDFWSIYSGVRKQLLKKGILTN